MIEQFSRTEILLENYTKVLTIEALTMLDMARKQIIPAGIRFGKELAETAYAKNSIGIDSEVEVALASKVSGLTKNISRMTAEIEKFLVEAGGIDGVEATAKYFRDNIFTAMQELRTYADELETVTPSDIWPMPTYSELLFNI